MSSLECSGRMVIKCLTLVEWLCYHIQRWSCTIPSHELALEFELGANIIFLTMSFSPTVNNLFLSYQEEIFTYLTWFKTHIYIVNNWFNSSSLFFFSILNILLCTFKGEFAVLTLPLETNLWWIVSTKYYRYWMQKPMQM